MEHAKPSDLLNPLPIPQRPWESISLDFISALPKVGELDSILVVVDRFSKYATFIPAPLHCSAKDVVQLFLGHVVKYWGVPQNIVNDRDPRFLGRFWKELFRLLGSKLYFSSEFHPETDGQTERVNALLEEYLRHFVSANQKDWVDLLDVAQFSYNLQKSSTSGHSPFELVTGQQPTTPDAIVMEYAGSCPAAFHLIQDWHQQREIARAHMEKVARRMKKWANQ